MVKGSWRYPVEPISHGSVEFDMQQRDEKPHFQLSLLSAICLSMASSGLLYLNCSGKMDGGVWGSGSEGYLDDRYLGYGWPFSDAIQIKIPDEMASTTDFPEDHPWHINEFMLEKLRFVRDGNRVSLPRLIANIVVFIFCLGLLYVRLEKCFARQ